MEEFPEVDVAAQGFLYIQKDTGEAKITKGYNLPCKYVIHTVGPIWHGGSSGEPKLLANCYKNSLLLAQNYSIRRIAFPSISTGVYAYPVDKAAEIAIGTVRELMRSMESSFDLVEWCLFDDRTYSAYEKVLNPF